MPAPLERPDVLRPSLFFGAIKTREVNADNGVISYARACGIVQSGG